MSKKRQLHTIRTYQKSHCKDEKEILLTLTNFGCPTVVSEIIRIATSPSPG